MALYLAEFPSLPLETVVAEMRRLGVTRVSVASMEVEVGPAPLAAPLPASTTSTADAALSLTEPECLCGHARDSEHGSQGCLHGCPVAACVGKREEPKP